MHLLKNFGTGGGATSLKAGPATSATKNNYFANLSLGAQKQKQAKKQKPQKRTQQGPPKGFIPEKFALDFDKPAIILQYRDPQSQKLYHHRMGIKKLRKETPTKQALDYLKKKHYHYFIPKVIDQAQIQSILQTNLQELIERLKNGLIGDVNEELGDVDEEDFDFDYDDDFDV